MPHITKANLLDLNPLSKITRNELKVPHSEKKRARRAVMTRGPFTIMFTYVSAVPWLMDVTVTVLKMFPFSQFIIAFPLPLLALLTDFLQKQSQHELQILQVLNIFPITAFYDFRRFTHIGTTPVKEFHVFC